MIQSFSNTKIKHIRRLQQRKYRQKSGMFVLEGSQLIAEALTVGFELLQLYCLPEAHFPWQKQAQECLEISSEVLAYASSLKSPPDAIAVFKLRQVAEDAERLPAWLVTESVQDPGNFGALMRLADAMNWRGILALGEYPDPFQSKVLRGSMASALRIPVQAIDYAELQDYREQGWQVLGSSLQAVQSSYTLAFQQPLLLLLGHEGQGLSSQALELCSEQVLIPLHPGVDSLNIVTAAAMLVHEACRQWSQDV